MGGRLDLRDWILFTGVEMCIHQSAPNYSAACYSRVPGLLESNRRSENEVDLSLLSTVTVTKLHEPRSQENRILFLNDGEWRQLRTHCVTTLVQNQSRAVNRTKSLRYLETWNLVTYTAVPKTVHEPPFTHLPLDSYAQTTSVTQRRNANLHSAKSTMSSWCVCHSKGTTNEMWKEDHA